MTRFATLAAIAALAPTALADVSTTTFGGGDLGFNELTNNGSLEQAVIESRIGNANPEAGIWEVGLWRFGAVGSPLDQAGRSIANGEVASFSISYDGANSLSMSIGDAEVSSSDIGGTFTDIFIRVRGTATSTVELSGLTLGGDLLDVSSITGHDGVSYLRISNGGAAFGAFTLVGNQSFSWDGARPNNSALAAQFKFTNVIPAPGAAALLGLGGLAAVRRRR